MDAATSGGSGVGHDGVGEIFTHMDEVDDRS